MHIGQAMPPFGFYNFQNHVRYHALCPLYTYLHVSISGRNQNRCTYIVHVLDPSEFMGLLPFIGRQLNLTPTPSSWPCKWRVHVHVVRLNLISRYDDLYSISLPLSFSPQSMTFLLLHFVGWCLQPLKVYKKLIMIGGFCLLGLLNNDYWW